VITDANIREYLLGRLDSEPELVDNIDEQILTDPSFSLTVDVAEDEIIEEYLEGSLSSEDARAVERHFLRPSERQRKLEVARLLGRYFESESRKAKAKQQTAILGVFNNSRLARLLNGGHEAQTAIRFMIDSNRRLENGVRNWAARPAGLVSDGAFARAAIGESRARPSSARRARGCVW